MCFQGRFRPWISGLLVLGGVGALLGFGSMGCLLAAVWVWTTFHGREAAEDGGKRPGDDDLSTESEIDPDAASGAREGAKGLLQ